MYYKNQKIIKKETIGRRAWFILENGEKVSSSIFRDKNTYIQIRCHQCNCLSSIKFYAGKNGLMNRTYICNSCVKKGNNNPFYGKKHSQKFKDRLSEERKGVWGAGEKNAMYGINLWDTYSEERTQDIKKRISNTVSGDKNPFYGKHHSEETKRKLSISSKDYAIKHPEHIARMTLASLKRQSSGFKSKIEQKVEQELLNRDMPKQYSKILHRKYQYDFLIGKTILLEVHGDYWHANPLYYGDDKKPLNERQLYKVEQDKLKKIFAEKYGYDIYYIWETEVNEGYFSVIDKIQAKLKSEKDSDE